MNIKSLWQKGSITLKKKLQKLIFPEGVIYDKINGAFRTPKINSVIAEISRLSGDLLLNEKGLKPVLSGQSLFAGREGRSSNLFAQDLDKVIEFLKQK